MPGQGSTWCGGIVERQGDKHVVAWNKFVANAPIHGQQIVHVQSVG
jgi:hypothetical protein